MDSFLLPVVRCIWKIQIILVRRGIMAPPQDVIRGVLYVPVMPHVLVEIIRRLCVMVGIINLVPVVQDVHSTARPVIMVHQVRGQHQIHAAISVQEQRGLLMIPRAVAARSFHPHAITVIKNNPAFAGLFLLMSFPEFVQ